MTRPTDAATTTTIRAFRTFGPSSLAALVASGLAVAIVSLESPVVLRIPAMVVLLLVPGAALVRLLTGNVADSLGDHAVRLPLSVLLGVLLWLAIALLLNAFEVSLRPTSLALGAGITGLVLVVLAEVRRHPSRNSSTPRAVAAQATKALRSGMSAAVATLVIVSAACCAAMMISKPVDRYTTLGLIDSKPFAGEIPVVTQGEPVRLNWMLRGVGCVPSPTLTSVRLTVDGNAVGDIAVDIEDDADATLTGAVTFTAPMVPGRYLLELVALPSADDGTTLPAPGHVSTFLEVEQ